MPETVVHFQIRMPPDLYEKLASWAKGDKVSLNALVVETLQEALRITNRTKRQACDCSPKAHGAGPS